MLSTKLAGINGGLVPKCDNFDDVFTIAINGYSECHGFNLCCACGQLLRHRACGSTIFMLYIVRGYATIGTWMCMVEHRLSGF